jgi:hypothetical protein
MKKKFIVTTTEVKATVIAESAELATSFIEHGEVQQCEEIELLEDPDACEIGILDIITFKKMFDVTTTEAIVTVIACSEEAASAFANPGEFVQCLPIASDYDLIDFEIGVLSIRSLKEIYCVTTTISVSTVIAFSEEQAIDFVEEGEFIQCSKAYHKDDLLFAPIGILESHRMTS